MNDFTPAQTQMIETWTEKRDTVLREIAVAETNLSDIRKASIEEGRSLAELHKSIAESKGRLSEFEVLEERHKNSVTIEIAELEARKSRLEGECASKENENKQAIEEENRISGSIKILCEAHDKMADQAKIVNKVVGEIIKTSELHLSNTFTAVQEIQIITNQVVEKSDANLKKADIILEILPKYIFELQRPIPVRRIYAPDGEPIAAPKDMVIEPYKINS